MMTPTQTFNAALRACPILNDAGHKLVANDGPDGTYFAWEENLHDGEREHHCSVSEAYHRLNSSWLVALFDNNLNPSFFSPDGGDTIIITLHPKPSEWPFLSLTPYYGRCIAEALSKAVIGTLGQTPPTP